MAASEPAPDDKADQQAATTKVIGDLDDLVQALLKATPESKPWQRQLLTHLREVDQGVQVLRMTISLGRGSAEIAGAAEAICRTLRAANSYVAVGRADMGTKAAMRLALELGQRTERVLQG